CPCTRPPPTARLTATTRARRRGAITALLGAETSGCCGHLAGETRNRIDESGRVEDVVVMRPRGANEALRLRRRGEESLPKDERHESVQVAVGDEQRDAE